MSQAILETRAITKTFPGVKALDRVDFSVDAGSVHALVGENGAGKTTLMLSLGGVYKPDSGEIILEGVPVTFSSPHEANRAGISVVYQDLSLVPNLSVAENIFARRQPVRGANLIDWDKLYRETTELLTLFGSEQIDPRTQVRELSIAKRQVVEILKAMSVHPKILILDEPTSSLTEVEARELFENIRKLKERQIAVIYISHHLPEIFEVADVVTILRDGRKVCDARVCDIDEDFLITNMVGRKIGNMYGEPPARRAPPAPLFEAKGLSREPSFSNISFDVNAGEIVGFAGLVGSGRTELGRAIFGAEPADHGEMLLNGRTIAPRSPKQAMRDGIGYLTEDRKAQGLYLDFSVRQNLVSNHLHDFAGSLLGFLRSRRMDDFARRSIGDFHIIATGPDQIVNNLSGGNQQKVLIGTWFGIQPAFLIVDEPTRGVDVGAKSDIYVFLRNLASRGIGIMVISSDLAEIIGISDRVYVMREGVIAGEISRRDATEETIIGLATGLKASRSKECAE
ncbi:MAG TPA: sugar ABC transporter ATP-binding protein [Spirochaetia bacterium]|nr:sugar ABC transporter ATP-binding protein [Spirochaetia bacterium]